MSIQKQIGEDVTLTFKVRNNTSATRRPWFQCWVVESGSGPYVPDGQPGSWYNSGRNQLGAISAKATRDFSYKATCPAVDVAPQDTLFEIFSDDGVTGIEFGIFESAFSIISGETIFEVSDLLIDPQKLEAGQTVHIRVWVHNLGTAPGVYTVTLRIDGQVVETKNTRSLNPGGGTTVSFYVTASGQGTRTVQVDGLSGTYEVVPEEQAYTISHLKAEPSQVPIGGEVKISYRVRNNSSAERRFYVPIKLNGEVVTTESTSWIPPGDYYDDSVRIGSLPEGIYLVEVDSATAVFTVGDVTAVECTDAKITSLANAERTAYGWHTGFVVEVTFDNKLSQDVALEGSIMVLPAPNPLFTPSSYEFFGNDALIVEPGLNTFTITCSRAEGSYEPGVFDTEIWVHLVRPFKADWYIPASWTFPP